MSPSLSGCGGLPPYLENLVTSIFSITSSNSFLGTLSGVYLVVRGLEEAVSLPLAVMMLFALPFF